MSRYRTRAYFNPKEGKECDLSVAYGFDHTPMGLFIQVYGPPIEEVNEDGEKYMNDENLLVNEDQLFTKLTEDRFFKICEDWKIEIYPEHYTAIREHLPF